MGRRGSLCHVWIFIFITELVYRNLKKKMFKVSVWVYLMITDVCDISKRHILYVSLNVTTAVLHVGFQTNSVFRKAIKCSRFQFLNTGCGHFSVV